MSHSISPQGTFVASKIVILAALSSLLATGETLYQKPPHEITDVLSVAPPPTISVSTGRDYALLLQSVRYPPIADVAQPMARLAGLRIDMQTNGLHLAPTYTQFRLLRLSDGKDLPLALPSSPKLGPPVWSPDGTRFAFTNTTPHGIDLWIGQAATGELKRVEHLQVNGVVVDRSPDVAGAAPGAAPMEWLASGDGLLVRSIPAGRGAPPVRPVVPRGPDVQEGSGHSGPVRTYEDMLGSSYDEDLFTYYATAQLQKVDVPSGRTESVGAPAIFAAASASPDGKHVLVERITKPFSYVHPAEDFPLNIDVWNMSGKELYQVARLPLADRVPIGGVRTGPRDCRWLPNESASLVWAEAMDGGNPKEKVPHRDRVLTFSAPFKGEPAEVLKTEQRFLGLEPVEKSSLALVQDYDRDKRWLRTFKYDLKAKSQEPVLVFERNQQDRYKDPGRPMRRTQRSSAPIIQSGDAILLSGLGASPTGEHPFLHRFNLDTKNTEQLFQSSPGRYETVEAVLDDRGDRFLTRRESPTDPPNYYIRSSSGSRALTHFKDPAPEARGVKKQLVTYKREDGVPLSFILYTPPGYKPGTKLPTLLWAYPLEFNDPGTAGQVSGSTDRFNILAGHLLFALHGYAVLENAGMPIVGDPQTVNDTYVKQLVMDAKAAIGKAVELGVTDPDRVGVGGHSYGAFMTANLIAHSSLFHAGVAESGAYNRTLTPFGFQNERRTIWEAPNVYLEMSPFMHAQDIKVPLLLIHGEADDNSGTFPIQSERLFQAIRGNGGTVRLVMLPSEAHAYRALETNEHVLWEEMRWLDKYLGGNEGTGASPTANISSR